MLLGPLPQSHAAEHTRAPADQTPQASPSHLRRQHAAADPTASRKRVSGIRCLPGSTPFQPDIAASACDQLEVRCKPQAPPTSRSDAEREPGRTRARLSHPARPDGTCGQSTRQPSPEDDSTGRSAGSGNKMQPQPLSATWAVRGREVARIRTSDLTSGMPSSKPGPSSKVHACREPHRLEQPDPRPTGPQAALTSGAGKLGRCTRTTEPATRRRALLWGGGSNQTRPARWSGAQRHDSRRRWGAEKWQCRKRWLGCARKKKSQGGDTCPP